MKYSSKLLLSALALLGSGAPVLARGVAEPGEVVLGGVEEVVEFEGERRFVGVARRDTVQRADLPRGLVRWGEGGVRSGAVAYGEVKVLGEALARGAVPGSRGVRASGELVLLGRSVARELPRGVIARGTVARGPVSSARTALVAAPLLGAPTRLAGGPSFPTGVLEAESLVGDLLREANAVRRLHGARRLVMDAGLTLAAERYARELARRGEIEHLSPTPGLRTFRDRITSAGVQARIGGENLARLSSSAERLGERTVQAWLRSPGHKYNLLDPSFARTGIGVWLGGDGIWYVVQVYATSS